jgi:hypothetical protein
MAYQKKPVKAQGVGDALSVTPCGRVTAEKNPLRHSLRSCHLSQRERSPRRYNSFDLRCTIYD